MNVPQNAGSKITVTAKLCYRKFSWWNTHFAYAGVSHQAPVAPQTSKGYDDRQFTFDGDLSKVSGKLHDIADLPIVVLAEDQSNSKFCPKARSRKRPGGRASRLAALERLRHRPVSAGRLQGRNGCVGEVTEADPKNPDGWINLGRVAVQEGDMERARTVLQKALKLSPDLARTHYFYARVLRSDGDYDGAAQHLQIVLKQYPKDRVARNDPGRVLFLSRKYPEAVTQLQEAIAVDPEDLQANYNLMLCYKGMGDAAKAAEYEKLYLRFKADESAQTITGPYRRLHPEDNNERQLIHEHDSAPLSPAKKPSAVAEKRVATTAGK